MVLKVYKLDLSPPARAVMMTVTALGIPDVEYVDVNFYNKEQLTEEYMKINPQHTVPTMIDGDFILWDSHAIAAYLVGKYAKDDSLYPRDIKKRAVVDQRLHFDSGILFPAAREAVFPLMVLGETKFRPERLAKIEPAYEFTEKFLDKNWIAGDQLTIADICCGASISALTCIIPIDEKKFPKLQSWLDKLSKEDFYIKSNKPGNEILASLINSRIN